MPDPRVLQPPPLPLQLLLAVNKPASVYRVIWRERAGRPAAVLFPIIIKFGRRREEGVQYSHRQCCSVDVVDTANIASANNKTPTLNDVDVYTPGCCSGVVRDTD